MSWRGDRIAVFVALMFTAMTMVRIAHGLTTFALPMMAALLFTPDIIRRHDVPDERYLALGSRFPSVVPLGRAGDATLIAPEWLLTAAHVARAFERRPGATVLLGGAEFGVSFVVRHPAWRELGEHDIALIRLAKPVSGVQPLPLYRGNREHDQIVTIVGHGGTGTGESRARTEDGRRRAATSKVDSVSTSLLFLSFSSPPNATEQEGAPGPGDSGGPALLNEGGQTFVAGISSAGYDGAHGPGSYGAIDAFTRVSTHIRWIDSVLSGPAPSPQTTPERVSADTTLPDSPAGRRYAAFLRAARAGSDSAVRAFVYEHFDEREYSSRPALIPNLVRLSAQIRGSRIESVTSAGPLQVTVTFNGPQNRLSLELVCAAQAPNKLVDWRRID